jgi:hypothetical protein
MNFMPFFFHHIKVSSHLKTAFETTKNTKVHEVSMRHGKFMFRAIGFFNPFQIFPC